MGDSPTRLLVEALRGEGFDSGLNLQIFEAEYNQIERQVFDPDSELYNYAPEIVILFFSVHKLLSKYNKLNPAEQSTFASEQLSDFKEITKKIEDRINTKIIFFNFPEINDYVFGNYGNKTDRSFIFQLRKLNYELMCFAQTTSSFFICDLSSIQNQIGKEHFFHPAIYAQTEITISPDLLPVVAKNTVDIIGAGYGKFKKCLILDLDNILWGGVVGDDGISGIQLGFLGIGKVFTELQEWIKKLKDRGIILTVCSKNEENTAKEPFEKHPDMVLNLDDIAVFIANWNSKADNIQQIQQILNIGFDSMVFLDDNPVERSIVRENFPEITVPELPDDPACYLEFLYALNLFETCNYSETDTNRTIQYQIEAKRIENRRTFVSENDFLQSLSMTSHIESFNTFNIPRVAQLSQRTNQFNLRLVRYTEAELEKMSGNKDFCTFAFTLKDKFGDNGLICAVVLKKEDEQTLFIDTWIMSCRVFNRGMETFTLNTIAAFAIENNYRFLKGEYIPGSKNELVKELFKSSGFKEVSDFWILDCNSYIGKDCFISKI